MAVALAAVVFLISSQAVVSAAQNTQAAAVEDDRAAAEILDPALTTAFSESLQWDVPLSASWQETLQPIAEPPAPFDEMAEESPLSEADGSGEETKVQPAIVGKTKSDRLDLNQDIFYANQLELSQEVGFLPINIPCPFNFLMGDPYVLYPLKYTLVPFILSFRWQIDNLHGPWFLRGNWELDTSGAAVWIPRGAETRYFAWVMGMRRNFVPRNWRVTPYWDWRIGLGTTNAKGPLGVAYAQGENFTFTLNMGSGVRYNFKSRYSLAAGLNWMHISNANLSQGAAAHTGIRNVGINVYGPVIGVNFQLRKRRRQSE